MKRLFTPLHLILPLTLLLHGFPAGAVTFTNDTAIGLNNTNYDGADIVVTNCTLTVDGPHSFASLQVLSGANLTHSIATNGYLNNHWTVTNEPQVLSVTNVAALSNPDVLVASIVVQDSAGVVTYTNGVDYVAETDSYWMTTLLLTTNSAIAEGSTNLVSYIFATPLIAEALTLTVAGDVTVAQGGMINTDGKGYAGGAGPGAGQSSGNPLSGSGAGHGGYGGQSAALGGVGMAYTEMDDSIWQPVSLGSGGGSGLGGVGGAGGGSVKLVVGGNLRVDGTVSANGVNGINSRSGGGSGGSIWVTCQNLSGAGVISANGGAGEPSSGGGGGGGRISLNYAASAFSGLTPARGGSGYIRGGAGTIQTHADGQFAGQVLVDNGGSSGMSTPISEAQAFNLTAQGGAIISLPYSQIFGNLLVASNAWICLSNQTVTITVWSNATIQAGGGIIADGVGYAGGQGTGAGQNDVYAAYTGGGGGHGGHGASGGGTLAYGGSTYGSVTAPMEFGSGGGSYAAHGLGGPGGGAVRLNVTGMLWLDGRISADGSPAITEGSGGGAGGSVWVTAGTLTGAGTISANGGMGNGFGATGGGGGGGGRIAIQYGMNLFFGITTSRGGSGSAWGGAGTIYTFANNQPYGQVLVDNGGQSGTNTSWSPLGTIDLTVKGGAVVSPPSSPIGTLLVASNGWVSIANQPLTVTGNATIQAGGGILADGTGSPAGTGSGYGRSVSTQNGLIGGGGGYGGYGASGAASGGYSPYGGIAYGSVTTPTDLGSGGGIYGSVGGPPPSSGSAGGGAIRLTVTGVLQVDGRISATGYPGAAANAGGGSGGSIWLTVGTLTGTGIISANGGMGNSSGGGGAGGRISIGYTVYDFVGVVSAYGGSGYGTGGAGTIYTRGTSQQWGLVAVDNGGQAGTNTTLGSASPGTLDLTVRNGAVLVPPSSQTIGTLLVASNGLVLLTNQTLMITGNATVQAGGGIIADGAGYAGGQGNGAGRSYSTSYDYVGGGGGYGGFGAAGASSIVLSAAGGYTYGYITTPTDLGSGGGGYSGSSGISAAGGAGGGAIRLTVTGTLQVDGRVSARGLAGAGPSAGGGSGGCINLSVGALAGSGVITANGGAGVALGGGGGGGRIAITYTSANGFSGLMSAYGGSGYATGGAGTIYTKGYSQSWGQVLLDNGGQTGTNTAWPSSGTLDVTVKGGASLAISGGVIGNLLIASNSWLWMSGTSASALNVSGNATIQAGGGIIADGTGYASGAGSGAGVSGSSSFGYVGSGGGYGGYGAASGPSPGLRGGYSYSAITSILAGSGGGGYSTVLGGPGGGLISFSVSGTLQVDGRISAAGAPAISPNGGGGSGGGISLSVGTLAGSGVIAANGGAGSGYGGGGGGGRIAISYTTSAFSGQITTYGGGGYGWGGAGTIYTKANSQGYGQVLVDNGGRPGTNTSWVAQGTFDLTVMGGAVVTPPLGSQTFGNLLVASNGWLSLSSQTLTVTGNATVQAGGGMLADGTGYGANQGTGAGKGAYSSSSGYVGGGGGHGGYGAASGGTTPAFGGLTYSSVTAPVDLGSGGGYNAGGSGGGAIRVTVTGALLVNGRLSANGTAGSGQGTGGGSGGSVWLTAGTLAGVGSISANGGAGNELGGGGGGGCVSVQYGVNAFEGIISAYGGGGYAWGGAGTVYTKANTQTMGQIVVDNGGQFGTNTPLAYLSPFDLTVRGGAIVSPSASSLLLSNLFLNTGGTLTCLPNQTNLDVAVLRNATIDAGGVMLVDGKGYGDGTGPGAGLSRSSIGSGAGYGGNGGASPLSAGGVAYGSAQQPVDRGSGGGFGWGQAMGGSEGGGAVRFTVAGVLTVNGRISADGNAGVQDDAGGGSGGSIWLTAGALTGNGAIAADGGAGELYDGGGGAGGRIAIYTPVNAFGGLVSTAGAAGAFPGQSGSLYSASTPPAPRVVSTTPVGAINAPVSSFNIQFSTAINPASISAAAVSLTAPGGVAVSNLVVSAVSSSLFSVSCPRQIAAGDYVITVGPQLLDLFGQPMSQVYTGAFTIVWSTLQGAVTDTNGLPVAGVVLQPDGGLASTTTDTNGLYLLSVPPAQAIQVTPSAPGLVFVPSSRTYYGVNGTVSNENYLAVSTIAPALAMQLQTNACLLNWYGLSGVTYQPLCSTNLVNWLPYNGPVTGTNGPMQLLLPMGTDPIMFFRVGASD